MSVPVFIPITEPVRLEHVLQHCRDAVQSKGYFKIGEFNEYENEDEETVSFSLEKGHPQTKLLVDVTTANMLVVVYDACNEKNKKLFRELPLLKAVTVGWKCVK